MRRSMLVLSLVSVISASVFIHAILAHAQTAKPMLTLDEFFNSVSFPSVNVSPDGNSVVIETERADWEQQIFRKELWLSRIPHRPSKRAPTWDNAAPSPR